MISLMNYFLVMSNNFQSYTLGSGLKILFNFIKNSQITLINHKITAILTKFYKKKKKKYFKILFKFINTGKLKFQLRLSIFATKV